MKKTELRKKYLELRKTLSKDEVLLSSEKIFKNFDLQFNVSENQNVHVFLPIKKFSEVNTMPFIEYLWKRKANVFVPKMITDQIISVAYTRETLLEENSWGILEPVSLVNETDYFDYIITPLLYCDAHGNRIGYGKGFYDRFFKTVNQDALKVGVNFFSPDEEIEDVSDSDIKMDYLVTPDEVLSFDLTSI